MHGFYITDYMKQTVVHNTFAGTGIWTARISCGAGLLLGLCQC